MGVFRSHFLKLNMNTSLLLSKLILPRCLNIQFSIFEIVYFRTLRSHVFIFPLYHIKENEKKVHRNKYLIQCINTSYIWNYVSVLFFEWRCLF